MLYIFSSQTKGVLITLITEATEMSFAKAVVKYRVLILVLTIALMVPSVFGYVGTRVNYDMLN